MTTFMAEVWSPLRALSSFRAMRRLAPLLLLALPAALPAQQPLQSVTGIVRDTAGTPLGGAEVVIAQRKATTTPSGTFRVDSLRPGQYAITIRLIGYTPVHSRVVVVASEPTEMEYFLVVAPVLLAPIVVESKRTGVYGAVGDTGFKAAVGARVQLLGLNGGEVLTDSMGRFAFPQAERGVYMVRVSYPGYTDRQFTVEVKRGEGRELGVLLSRATSLEAPFEGALKDLGSRLATGLEKERMLPRDLERYASGGLCDIPRIKSVLGTSSNATTTLILNGVTIRRDFEVRSLCSWRADEVELVEFAEDICRDVTQSIAQLLGTWCGVGRAHANQQRSMTSGGGAVRTQGAGGSYVIIWEKR